MRYGDDANDCSTLKLQFDTGRGTVMRLSELGISPEQLNAVFFTHMHNDHTEGFADMVTLRWMFFASTARIDTICSSDVVSTLGFSISCQKFTTHVADAFLQSGEAQRHSEIKQRSLGGPADLINTITFTANDQPQTVWASGDVTVSAMCRIGWIRLPEAWSSAGMPAMMCRHRRDPRRHPIRLRGSRKARM